MGWRDWDLCGNTEIRCGCSGRVDEEGGGGSGVVFERVGVDLGIGWTSTVAAFCLLLPFRTVAPTRRIVPPSPRPPRIVFRLERLGVPLELVLLLLVLTLSTGFGTSGGDFEGDLIGLRSGEGDRDGEGEGGDNPEEESGVRVRAVGEIGDGGRGVKREGECGGKTNDRDNAPCVDDDGVVGVGPGVSSPSFSSKESRSSLIVTSTVCSAASSSSFC